MQVMKKRRIVLASVLKPVTDTRMFEKLGMSLAGLPNVEVHIIGFPVQDVFSDTDNVRFYTVSSVPFKRLSSKRVLAPWLILAKVIRLKPDFLVIATHELLWAAVMAKLLTRCKIIYDVQENYFYNILHTRAFPFFIRPLVAAYVRVKEYVTAPLIHRFLLAEKGYFEELPFAKPFVVLENKLPGRLVPKTSPRKSNAVSKLIFSGTISETTGVLEAIDLAVQLRNLEPGITLTIVGHCPSGAFLKRLMAQSSDREIIRLVVSDFPIPHQTILKELQQADAGIIIYPPNPATASSIPTKVYEYLALGLPVLIRHNEASHELIRTYRAGIIVDQSPDPKLILEQLNSLKPLAPGPGIFWESQEPDLLLIF